MRRAVVHLAAVSTMLLATADLLQGVTTKQLAEQRLDRSADVLDEIIGMQDKGIPQQVIENAKCIAIVPTMLMGGFVFGTRQGQGVATCKIRDGWSAPTFFTIIGGKWGMQFGVQDVDLVMVVMNTDGMQDIVNNAFELGANVSAAAGAIGCHAVVQTDWQTSTKILTYSHAKGIFSGISLAGAWISPDRDAVISVYGKQLTAQEILSGGISPTPEANKFLKTVNELEQDAK